MLFSAQYTRYKIIPSVPHPGRPEEVKIDLTINAALLVDWDNAGQNLAGKIITSALNTYAGGRRTFRHTPVSVTWSLTWGHPHRHNNALGVSLIPKALLLSAGEGGCFCLSETGGRKIGDVLLPAEDLGWTARKPGSSAADSFRRTAAHEFGHAQALVDVRDDRRSIMYFRQLNPSQLRRIKQRWTDHELRDALQHLFEPVNLPPWLHS